MVKGMLSPSASEEVIFSGLPKLMKRNSKVFEDLDYLFGDTNAASNDLTYSLQPPTIPTVSPIHNMSPFFSPTNPNFSIEESKPDSSLNAINDTHNENDASLAITTSSKRKRIRKKNKKN
jgi:hypothetical protein